MEKRKIAVDIQRNEEEKKKKKENRENVSLMVETENGQWLVEMVEEEERVCGRNRD